MFNVRVRITAPSHHFKDFLDYPCIPYRSCNNFRNLAASKKKLITNHNMKYQKYLPASRKEVFQPHLPVRLPCYDLAPVTDFTLKRDIPRSLGTADSHGLTGGVYKARERIHRAMADARLLANPASWSRVTDSNPN